MNYILKDFGKQLKHNHLEMRRHFSSRGTNAYRVYDRNIADLPVSVDLYGRNVYVVDYRQGFEIPSDKIADVVSRMLYVRKEDVIYKIRFPGKGGEQPSKGQLSETKKIGKKIVVMENGLSFLVNLNDYIDTGLFLDHRKTREMVRSLSGDKKVLNLFAYTGSFSVYAAVGGAERVETVDLSGNYLKWAGENFLLNNLPDEKYTFSRMDVSKFLVDAKANRKKYDVIILDPPTFSNSRNMKGTFDIQRDYISVIGSCRKLLSKDGFILFSTNYRKFHFDPGRLKGVTVKEITRETIDVDFSKKRRPHRCWIIR